MFLPQTMDQAGIPRALPAGNLLLKERELSLLLKRGLNFCLLAVCSEAPVDGERWVSEQHPWKCLSLILILIFIFTLILILISGRGRARSHIQRTAGPEKFPKIIAVNDRNEIEEIRALLAITPLPAFLLVNCLIPNESSGL